jgi:hypothetical protein
MSSKTTNLNLTKPSEDEFYDINVQNENMDIIDREINGLKQPAYEVSTAMSDLHSGEMITVAFGKIAKAVSTLISHITSKATSSVLGHVKLSDSTSSTSASTAGVAATPKAVKAAYDLANSNTKKLGTTDISGIGDGTVTGAIVNNKEAIEDVSQSLTIIKENLIPFPYCATSTGSYAKSFNSSSLTTVEAKNDGSLLIGSNGKIPSKTNQVLFRLIHDNFENIPLYNDIYSMDPHFENRPSASGVALAVSFERAKDSELETFYVTSPVEINNIDGKYTKIKYISVWLSTATASFENVKMKPTITRGGITEKRDVVSQKLSTDAIVARTRNSLNIVHLPLKETKTLTLAQLYNSYAKQNNVLYVTVIDYSDSKSYKSSTMLLFIDDFQIYAISTEGLLKYDNVNDKWAVIIPRA